MWGSVLKEIKVFILSFLKISVQFSTSGLQNYGKDSISSNFYYNIATVYHLLS